MFKKIDDLKSDLFLNPIPKWITVFGFWGIIILFFGLVSFSALFPYSNTILLDVSIKAKGAFVKTNFDNFSQFYEGQTISINIPTLEKPIDGILIKEKALINKNMIFIPVSYSQKSINSLRFTDEIICKGTIITNKGSLLDKLLNSK